MSANTIAENKRMTRFDGHHSVWLFGYGSLIFKCDFPFIDRQPASIMHWQRRFWQGSHDHRGTHESPGRVVTLMPREGAVCEGMAYLISPEVFGHLDVREKNGYLRLETELSFKDGSSVKGLAYIATEQNAAFLGPASELEIAEHIARSAGPSGRNRDYLTALANALRDLSADDHHVFEIERHLIELGKN